MKKYSFFFNLNFKQGDGSYTKLPPRLSAKFLKFISNNCKSIVNSIPKFLNYQKT